MVVEERYSRLLTLPYVAPGFVADLLARVQVRAWARGQGMSVPTAGRLPAAVRAAYEAVHQAD